VNSYAAVGFVIVAAVVVIVAVAAVVTWLDARALRALPEVDVDAEEELEHLARRQRLHVVKHDVPPTPIRRVGPYDWFREEDWQ
jgi:hypothetical protein